MKPSQWAPRLTIPLGFLSNIIFNVNQTLTKLRGHFYPYFVIFLFYSLIARRDTLLELVLILHSVTPPREGDNKWLGHKWQCLQHQQHKALH